MSTLRLTTISNQTGSSSVPSETVINGSAKAWVNFNGTGTVAIRASFNVSSITDNGVGDYTANFTTAMVDANYAAASQANTAASYGYTAFERASKSTSSYRVQCATTNNYTSTDCDQVTVAIFR